MSHTSEEARARRPSAFPSDQHAELRKRIAFHSENGPGIGGSDLIMGAIADRLDRARWDAHVLVRPDYPTGTVFRQPAPVRIGGADGATAPPRSHTSAARTEAGLGRWAKRAALSLIPPVGRRWLGYRRCTERVRKALTAHRIALFQTMDGGPQATVLGARRAGCRVVAVYSAPPPDGPVDRLTRTLARRSFAAADARVGMSRHSIGMWAAFLDVDAAAFRLIYNGADVELLAGTDPARVRAELDIPRGALVVGMTGRMTREKGPAVLARAAVAVAGAHPEALFLFTGDGAERPAVEQIFRDAGLSHRVRMLGFRTDAPRVAAAYDVAVVPSVFPEPFGLVVTEAMARAKPVIGSRTGGIPEIVVNGKTGVLVEPGDPVALAGAIAELLAAPARRTEMGREGFERVTQQFTRTAMIDGYEGLYRELLAGAPEHPR